MELDLYQLLTQRQHLPYRLNKGLYDISFPDIEPDPVKSKYKNNARSCAICDEISKWEYYCKKAGVAVFRDDRDAKEYFLRIFENMWMG